MSTHAGRRQTALTFDAEVHEQGRVEVYVPLSPGSRVTVFVITQEDDLAADLTQAAESSLDFWDNSWDEEWDRAEPG